MSSKNITLKICGLRNKSNIETIVKEIKVNYLGFIFYEKSKRYVGEDFEMPEIATNIKKVGVFVNPTIEYLESKIQKYNLEAVQLHAEETVDFCKSIKKNNPNLLIIKAFSVDNDFDFTICEQYENIVDVFLWDTKGKEYGGNGVVFDWNILKNYQGNQKSFVSGGITLATMDNLLKFINTNNDIKIIGIDINSGFEIEPALKDINLLQKIDMKNGKKKS